MREKMEHVKHAAEQKMWKVRAVLVDRSGENFIDSAIKILLLMAVVIGALLLAGLYALFSENVLPTLSRRITEMFNYAG